MFSVFFLFVFFSWLGDWPLDFLFSSFCTRCPILILRSQFPNSGGFRPWWVLPFVHVNLGAKALRAVVLDAEVAINIQPFFSLEICIFRGVEKHEWQGCCRFWMLLFHLRCILRTRSELV